MDDIKMFWRLKKKQILADLLVAVAGILILAEIATRIHAGG